MWVEIVVGGLPDQRRICGVTNVVDAKAIMVFGEKKEVAGQGHAESDSAVVCLCDSDRVSGVGDIVGAETVGGVGEVSIVPGHGHRRSIAAVVGATDADQADLRKHGEGCV
jgi:hypothetical protein